MPRGAKPLWDRFAVYYFRRLPPLRFWKRASAAGGAVVALAWIALSLGLGDERPFSSGPMSIGHVMLADQCIRCHAPPTRFSRFSFWSDADKAHALNRACLDCHGNTIAFDPDTTSAWHQVSPAKLAAAAGGGGPAPREPRLACSACHHEHEGFVRLTRLDDRHCTSCHADLHARMPDAPFHPRIAAFDPAAAAPALVHPEFRALADGRRDETALRFNHRVHLRDDPLDPSDPDAERGIPGPEGGHVVLRCDDCHRAGRSSLPWRFARRGARADERALVGDVRSGMQDPFMAPIRFDLHCAACHQPAVGLAQEIIPPNEDAGLGQGEVPHGAPGEVRTYLEQRLLKWAMSKREDRFKPPAEDGRFEIVDYENAHADSDAARAAKLLPLIREASKRLEASLFGGDPIARPADQRRPPDSRASAVSCAFCHETQYDSRSDEPPSVTPPRIPQRWLEHATFSHLRHREVASLRDVAAAVAARPPGDRGCLHCHAGVLESEATADVSLPGIDLCRECHGPATRIDGRPAGGVQYSCVTCHSYHRPAHSGAGAAADRTHAVVEDRER